MTADKKPAMEAFFTRAVANEGIQLPLYTPDGLKSEHWLRVRGIDSDEFRAAEADAKRDAFRIASLEDAHERSVKIAESKLRLISALVMGWSFDQPCTPEAVVSFFREAPQVADAVDTAASRRALFFAARSSSSESTPSMSSAST